MSVQAFVAAYHVLEILEENGATPVITLSKEGSCTLCLTYENYRDEKIKSLAEDLLISKSWYSDSLGNCILISKDGLKEKEYEHPVS